jgi:hypothetical protein
LKFASASTIFFWGGFAEGDSDDRFYFSIHTALEQGFDDLPALEDIRR